MTTGVNCPTDGCPFTATDRTELRKHFATRHVRDNLVIVEEGPLPRCEDCDMFVPAVQLPWHRRTPLCKKNAARKEQRLAAEDGRRCHEAVFTAYGQPLDNVWHFKYLGRILSHDDKDNLAMYYNMRRARSRWGLISRILTCEGANPRVSAMFYKAVVQTVLLYGSETWNVTQSMRTAMESFHRRVARSLTGRKPLFVPETEEWIYPPLGNAMEEAGLFSIEEYLERRRRYLVDYVATHPLAATLKETGAEGILAYYNNDNND